MKHLYYISIMRHVNIFWYQNLDTRVKPSPHYSIFHSIARFSLLGYFTRFSLCHPNCHAAIKNHVQVTGKGKGCLSFNLKSDRLERTRKSTELELRKKSPGGVLPIIVYRGRLRPKGVPFSRCRYMKE